LKATIKSAWLFAVNKSQKAGGSCILSEDEIAALHIYTLQSPFYEILNALLRSPDRNQLKPFFPYLNLVVTALYKLLARQGLKMRSLFRGVKLDLASKFPVGSLKFFWTVTSTAGIVVLLHGFVYFSQSSAYISLFSIIIFTRRFLLPLPLRLCLDFLFLERATHYSS
jgi:hypothetical protein